jgi:hypothetical protein
MTDATKRNVLMETSAGDITLVSAAAAAGQTGDTTVPSGERRHARQE